MIILNGCEEEYILDLNEYPENIHKLNIQSYSDDDKLYWYVYFVSNKNVSAKKTGDTLIIEVNFKLLKKPAIIVIRNINKETFKIRVLPNIEATMEKKYDFCIDNEKIFNGILSFDIISKRNEKDFPWKCVYLGTPLLYEFSKTEFDGSTNVNVKLKTRMFSQYPTKLIFQQEESGNKIKLSLLNDKNGIIKVG